MDSFFLEVPFTAIVFAVLLVVGAVWLRRPRRAPVVLIGLICLLQLVFVVVFFLIARPSLPPSGPEIVIGVLLGVVSGLGLAAAVGALRAPQSVVTPEP